MVEVKSSILHLGNRLFLCGEALPKQFRSVLVRRAKRLFIRVALIGIAESENLIAKKFK